MRYLSDDGKVFNTLKECEEYESEKNSEEARKKELEKEKGTRSKELEKAEKHYHDLLEQYVKDFMPDEYKFIETLTKLLSF